MSHTSDIINSKAQHNEDDASITIIHASIVDDNLPHHATNSSHSGIGHRSDETGNFHQQEKDDIDFIYVEQDRLQCAQELEKIVQHYFEDLKQENKTQIDCSRQLVIRLMDIVRVAYSKDSSKLEALNKFMDQIDDSHDRRFIQEKEAIEQYKVQIANLKRQIMSMEAEPKLISSYPNSINESSFQCVDEWTEFEDDTNKLRKIIEQQQEHINQILKLINDSGIDPTTIGIDQNEFNQPYNIPSNRKETTEEGNETLEVVKTSSFEGNTEPLESVENNHCASPIRAEKPIDESPEITSSNEPANIPRNDVPQIHHEDQADDDKKRVAKISLFERFRKTLNEDGGDQNLAARSLSNISPGSTPTEATTALLENLLGWASETDSVSDVNAVAGVKETQDTNTSQVSHTNQDREPFDNDEATNDEGKYSKCPICSKLLPITPEGNRETIYDHLEVCLAPPSPLRPRKQPDLICPICETKFPHTNETVYHQHINDCLNRND